LTSTVSSSFEHFSEHACTNHRFQTTTPTISLSHLPQRQTVFLRRPRGRFCYILRRLPLDARVAKLSSTLTLLVVARLRLLLLWQNSRWAWRFSTDMGAIVCCMRARKLRRGRNGSSEVISVSSDERSTPKLHVVYLQRMHDHHHYNFVALISTGTIPPVASLNSLCPITLIKLAIAPEWLVKLTTLAPFPSFPKTCSSSF